MSKFRTPPPQPPVDPSLRILFTCVPPSFKDGPRLRTTALPSVESLVAVAKAETERAHRPAPNPDLYLCLDSKESAEDFISFLRYAWFGQPLPL